MESVESGERGLEGEFLPCALQLLGEIGGSCEEDAVSVVDEGEADGGGEMGFAGAGRAEGEAIDALFEPTVSGCESVDPCFGEGRHGGELEAVEAFAGGQAGFAEVSLPAPPIAVRELVLGERGEQASGGPAFGVGPLCEGLPEVADGWQPQGGQHQVELFRIDLGSWRRAYGFGSCSRLR